MEGEAWRDDSLPPCKIDLGGGTGYHKNMRKREKTQESKGEATKNAPGRRTATKTKKATKGTTGTEVNLLAEMVKRIEPDRRVKSPAQINWEDAAFRSERVKELKEALNRRDVDADTAIRELFDSNKNFTGLCVYRWYLPDENSFLSGNLAPKPTVKPFDEFVAKKVETQRLENENHRAFYDEAIRHARTAQRNAELSYRAYGLDGLRKFLATRDDFGEVFIIISGKKKRDLLFIDWSLDRNMEMRKDRVDDILRCKLTAGKKQALVGDMSTLEEFGLWKPSRQSDLNGLSEFATEALLRTAQLMITLKVPMRMLFRKAELAIEAEKKAELAFSLVEVQRLINSCPHDGIKEILQSEFVKLIQKKTLLIQRDYAEWIDELRPKS